jgi:hypothetical protein
VGCRLQAQPTLVYIPARRTNTREDPVVRNVAYGKLPYGR